ncbi:putative phosphatidate phosphatase isoform X1 [Plodia interpunctella]|uniref:putative phosphatidate phosphatase isoform X1 n=1 Tax=Plodia interpunctella TaxID=58824 RepID=UPI0023683EE4|nr:putative phosphatidate phosphatase isoform X1 [Plodia interpunctella]
MACDRIFCNVFLDVLVLACVCIPLLLLQIYAKPYRRGYFESDESIRYRYWEQSISETVLGIFGFIIVIIIVLVTEICQKNPGPGSGKKFLAGKPIAGWVWDSYRTIGVYSFGAACQQLTVTIGKYTLGRLRPHFYEVCQPVPADSALNHLGYIVNYNCAGTDEARIMNARLSFPSGHSCYAMYTTVFLICYFQYRCKWRGSKLLRHFAQYLVFIAAWYVGLTRVQEYHHHWSDVAGGFFIGAVIALFTFVYILKPKTHSSRDSWQSEQAALPRPVLAR